MQVLIATHFFPPLNRMGSSRPYSWARSITEAGHDVTVLTSRKESLHGPLTLPQEMTGLEVVEVALPLPAWNYRQSCNRYHWLCLRLLYEVNYYLWVLRCLWRIARIPGDQIDVVVSTYSPGAAHILGAFAKWYKGAWWVADYRDLWAENPYAERGAVGRVIVRSFENLLVRRADAITTVSDPFAERLRKRFGNSDVHVVYNGFDRQDRAPASKSGKEERFRIVYTGTIYSGKRDPSPLFQAIRMLERSGRLAPGDFQILFYGDRHGNLPELIRDYGMEKWVDLYQAVPREKALEIQREADVLLFLDWQDPRASGTIPGKLFEYLAAGRPVIAVGVTADATSGRLLEQSGIGVALGEDPEAIGQALLDAVQAPRPSWFRPNWSYIQQYSRQRQGERLMELISAGLGG